MKKGPGGPTPSIELDEAENPMKRLFREYGRENLSYFGIGLVASLLARSLDLIPPLVLGIAIDAVFVDTGPFRLPLVPSSMLPATQEGQFWLSVALIAGAFLGAAGFHWLRNWGWNNFAQNIQHTIRVETYDRMQRLEMGFFDDKQTGELMSILSNDVNRLEKFLNDGMNSAMRLGVMVFGIAAILFYLNWQLALVALVPVPLVAIFTYKFVRTIQPKYATVRSTVGSLNSRLENNLGGIQVIKSSNAEPYERDRVEDSSLDYYDANWDAIYTRIKFFPALRILAGLGFATTFIIGGIWVFSGPPGPFTGELTVGSFVTFIFLTQRFIWPVSQFGQIINMYQRARASSARVFGLMDESASAAEDLGGREMEIEDPDISFRDVSFSYDDENQVLSDVSFEVEPGETVALVGPTGSGKTTLLKLLMRMYDPDDGEILIDGTDTREISPKCIREAVGYVSQDPYLFYGSVEENIRYGAFDATDEDIRDAAKAAQAHDFIQQLPDGYETMVGERGVKLSGGQRQRVSIARALIRDPDILVLDEATSDVDTETEMLIKRGLDALTENRTTFAIAHRLSTIKNADNIVVIDKGSVVETGTHEELLETGGLYADLWRVQAGEVDQVSQRFLEEVKRGEAVLPD